MFYPNTTFKCLSVQLEKLDIYLRGSGRHLLILSYYIMKEFLDFLIAQRSARLLSGSGRVALLSPLTRVDQNMNIWGLNLFMSGQELKDVLLV